MVREVFLNPLKTDKDCTKKQGNIENNSPSNKSPQF